MDLGQKVISGEHTLPHSLRMRWTTSGIQMMSPDYYLNFGRPVKASGIGGH